MCHLTRVAGRPRIPLHLLQFLVCSVTVKLVEYNILTDIESMHQSFADILASPSRNLKEAEISFEAITGTKLSTLEGEENSGDECNESSSSQPVGNEGKNGTAFVFQLKRFYYFRKQH